MPRWLLQNPVESTALQHIPVTAQPCSECLGLVKNNGHEGYPLPPDVSIIAYMRSLHSTANGTLDSVHLPVDCCVQIQEDKK